MQRGVKLQIQVTLQILNKKIEKIIGHESGKYVGPINERIGVKNRVLLSPLSLIYVQPVKNLWFKGGYAVLKF